MAINPKIKEKAEKIRKEVYGKDVREALASGLEVMSEDVEETKQRQDNVESQFQAVLDETTGKDVISAPEIIAARVGADDTNYPNLKERLDTEYQKLSSQLAQTGEFFKTNHILFKGYNNTKFMQTIIDDDGTDDTYFYLKPALDAIGVVACSAVIPRAIDQNNEFYMTWEQVHELQNAGWEIMSHTYQHYDLTTMTPEEQEFQIGESYRYLTEKGFDVQGIVYPYGKANHISRSISKKYYKYGFMGYGVNFLPIDQFRIHRVIVGEDNSKTLEDFKAEVDKAHANNGWIVWCLHANTTNQEQLDNMIGAIQYGMSLGGDVVTAKEAIQHFGNALEMRNEETGDYVTITNTGKLYSTSSLNPIDAYDYDTPITAFPKGVTYTPISFEKGVKFPEGRAGVLITYKLFDNIGNIGFNWQEYQIYGRTDKYIRRVKTDGTFDAFTKEFNIKPVDYYSGSTPISEFPLGVTHTPISTNNAGDMPEQKAGTLTTYKVNAVAENAGFNWQEYKILGSTTTYIRSATTSGFTEWRKKGEAIEIIRSIESQVIPANSGVSISVPVSGIDLNNVISVIPKTFIPSGLSWSFYTTANALGIRILNGTTQDITLPTVDWGIKIV